MSHLTELELDRIHAHLFSDEEKLRQDYNGDIKVSVDAQDVEDLVDSAPETAWEVFEAHWDNQAADYDYSGKYLGEYTEHLDGSFSFEPYSD